MADAKRREWLHLDQKDLVDAARTTVATVASMLFARLFRLPEAYWAGIATIIVMQSTLGAAWTISKERLIGTAFGAATGALLSTYMDQSLAAFGAGVFAMGVLCAFLGVGRGAYRYAGITLIVVMMIARTAPAWIVAIHRFIEISVGIAVGLLVTAVWPESETAPA
ncbi:MAG TPA: FUSC family protein [Candidatus Acidoferrum sp.]|nr:FUSC family protein [Candidatus Acidoferrum sp.]